MANEFIAPNWHPLFIHFPIALVITGVLIEIVSFAWPRGGFRAAGRWMMLLGALLAIPTATAGIYAFRNVVTSPPAAIGTHWQQIVQQSKWLPYQWDLIEDHIWLNSIAGVIFVLSVILWLGGSDNWRRKAYWPLLIAMIVGVGLMIAGAWHGGEMVYRFATAVNANPALDTAGRAIDQAAGQPVGQVASGLTIAGHDVTYFVPPLQLHMVLAGFAVMFVVAAFSLMLRRWYLDVLQDDLRMAERQPVAPAVTPEGTSVSMAERAELRRPHGEQGAMKPPRVYPGWFWLGAVFLGLATAAAGAWSVVGVFTRQSLEQDLQMLREPGHLRLLLHVVFGVSIVVLSLVLAVLVRFARRARWLSGVLGVIVLLLIAKQVWLGTLLTYDGQGPLLGFAAAAAAAEPGERGQQGPASQPANGPGAAPDRQPAKQPRQPGPAPQPQPATSVQPGGVSSTPPAARAQQPAPAPSAAPAPSVSPATSASPAPAARQTEQPGPSSPGAEPLGTPGESKELPGTGQEPPQDSSRHEEVGATSRPGE